MKRTIMLSSLVFTLLLSAFTVVYLSDWQVKEDDYAVKFKTKGASGTFKGLKGTINFDKANPEKSHFDVTVDVNTIGTGIGLKNRHAKNEDFFNAEKYPTIRFTSAKIVPSGNGFLASGTLTIKDVSKEVTIPFTFEDAGNEGVFRGGFELNRKDYNLEKNRVGEVVKVELVVPVNKRL